MIAWAGLLGFTATLGSLFCSVSSLKVFGITLTTETGTATAGAIASWNATKVKKARSMALERSVGLPALARQAQSRSAAKSGCEFGCDEFGQLGDRPPCRQ